MQPPMPAGPGAPMGTAPAVTAGSAKPSGLKIGGIVLIAVGVVVFGGLSLVYGMGSNSADRAADIARRHMGSGPISRALEDKADSEATLSLVFGLFGMLMIGGGFALVVVGGKGGSPPPRLPFAGSAAPPGPPPQGGPPPQDDFGGPQGGYGGPSA